MAELTPQERARRERAARLLGDLMPDTTSDERPEGWGEGTQGSNEGGGTSRDDELRRDVPPHHGKD